MRKIIPKDFENIWTLLQHMLPRSTFRQEKNNPALLYII